nr:MAG TPA: hypothetical protein [Caudoviricetes sp.]
MYKVRIIQLFWGRLQNIIFDATPSIVMHNRPWGWLKIQAEICYYYKGKSSNITLGYSQITPLHISTQPPLPSPSFLSAPRATPSSKPHTCAVFHTLATYQYRAILLQ